MATVQYKFLERDSNLDPKACHISVERYYTAPWTARPPRPVRCHIMQQNNFTKNIWNSVYCSNWRYILLQSKIILFKVSWSLAAQWQSKSCWGRNIFFNRFWVAISFITFELIHDYARWLFHKLIHYVWFSIRIIARQKTNWKN